ncbi:MAG TPA: acyl-CoA thioesterase [Candidatus Sulfotelmatobacter sp.]|nr:acyl-CoA thioesterase [Candidatus Sulfotelmatobacter sp.]
MEGRSIGASRVVISQVMGPTEANVHGNVHGGVIMKLVDEAGAVAALRHCRSRLVTVSIDSLSFLHPVRIGNLLTLHAEVTHAGRTSVETEVRVEAENMLSGQVTQVASAYVVYVALDEGGRPAPVPPLLAETDEDRRRMEQARLRREARLAAARARGEL